MTSSINTSSTFQTRKALRILAGGLAVAAFGLSGCVSSGDAQALREEPGYVAGWSDGCSTAIEENKSFSTTRARDEYAFDNDRAYRAGWRQGYLECTDQVPESTNGGRLLGEDDRF